MIETQMPMTEDSYKKAKEFVEHYYSTIVKPREIKEKTEKAKSLVGTYWAESQHGYYKITKSDGPKISYIEVHVSDESDTHSSASISNSEADNPWFGEPYTESVKPISKKEFDEVMARIAKRFTSL